MGQSQQEHRDLDGGNQFYRLMLWRPAWLVKWAQRHQPPEMPAQSLNTMTTTKPWPMTRRIGFGIATAGVLVTVGCVVLNYVPSLAPHTTSMVFWSFAALFPVFWYGLGRAARAQVRYRRQLPPMRLWDRIRREARQGSWEGFDYQSPLRRLPHRTGLLVPILIAFLGISALTGLPRTKGQPEVIGNHYYADDHGYLIPLTYKEWQAQTGEWQRGFAGISGIFYMAGWVLILGRYEDPPRLMTPAARQD